MRVAKELARIPLQRIHAGVIWDSCRISRTSNKVPLELVKELAKIPVLRINAGPSGQLRALLTVSAEVLMNHRMQSSNRPFELS